MELYIKLLIYYYKFLDIFNQIKANKLPLYKGKGVDYNIKLLYIEGKEADILQGALYSISRDKLLIL